MTDPRELAERIRLDGLVQGEASALAGIWGHARVLAILCALRERAVEARDESASGEVLLRFGLAAGKLTRTVMTTEQPI